MQNFPLIQACDTYEEWRRLRATFIGASEASAILGLNPWKNLGEVWLSKVRAQEALEDETPIIEDEIPNRFTFWGSRLEPVIIDVFAEETGYTIERPGLVVCRHPDYPMIGATLDARAVSPFGDKSIVEAKATDAFYQWRESVWGPSMSDEVPEGFLIQLMQQLAVVHHEGYLSGWLAVLIGGNQFRRYEFAYDADIAAMLIERLVWFWGLVTRREPPPFDYTAKGAVELQKRVWNKVHPGSQISVPSTYRLADDRPTILELIIEHDDMKAVAEEATARQEAAKAELIHIAGPNALVTIEDMPKLGITRTPKAGYHVNAYDVKPYIETSFTPRTEKKRRELLNEERKRITGQRRQRITDGNDDVQSGE